MGNIIKKKVNNGENVLGAFVNMYAPSLVEMIGYAGFDFVIIDDEHGAFSSSELENMIRAAEIVNITPVVRVSYNLSSIQKALDRGAKGIQVPMVNNAKDAEAVVAKAKYPPLGNRGTAYSIRPAKFGQEKGKAYLDKANEDVLIVVHIETSEAVKNFREIANVPGVDVAFVGSTDLSVSMGYPEGPEHQDVQKVIDELFETAGQFGVKMGTVSGNRSGIIEGFAKGASYVGVVVNSVIFSAMNEITKTKNDVK